MGGFKEKSFGERLSASGDAKKAALAKFLARPAADDPAVAARRAERETLNAAREVRLAERAAERAAEEARQLAEQTVRAAEKVIADAALEAKQKATRDARYAARKARR